MPQLVIEPEGIANVSVTSFLRLVLPAGDSNSVLSTRETLAWFAPVRSTASNRSR